MKSSRAGPIAEFQLSSREPSYPLCTACIELYHFWVSPAQPEVLYITFYFRHERFASSRCWLSVVSWAGDSCGRSTCYSTSSSFCFFLQLAQSMYMLIPYYIIICSFLVLLLLFKVWEGCRLLSNFYFAAKQLVANVEDPSNREDGHHRIVNPITRTIKTKKRKREHKI